MILRRLFGRGQDDQVAYELYGALVRQARQPALYLEFEVPDTVTGRFEMVMLHAYLVLDRLKSEGPQAGALSQQIFDVMFDDMDQSLREMGVGDLSVGKRIKKMASMFYGRVAGFDEGIEALEKASGSPAVLEEAIARNVYPDSDKVEEPARKLARYLMTCHRGLADQPLEDFLAGRVLFPEVESAVDG